MDEKLMKDVKAVVAEIFSDKEEVEMQRKAEKALQKSATTIEELTTTLEESSTKNEDLVNSVAVLETSVGDLTSELEAAKTKIEEATQKLAESEKAIEEINKDRAAELRMAELVEAGVTGSDNKAQASKVREMSEKDFASYRDELVSLRKAVVAELSNSEGNAAGESEEGTEGSEGSEGSEEGSEGESDDGTPPANIDPQNAISAALNMEIQPSKGMTEKYAELGKAMADQFKPE